MCAPTKPTISRDRFRCRPAVTTRGQCCVANLADPAIPSTSVAVSRTSVVTPVARVAYHSVLGPVTTPPTRLLAAPVWPRAAAVAGAADAVEPGARQIRRAAVPAGTPRPLGRAR